MKFLVAMIMTLGFSMSASAGCGHYIALCTYIDKDMSVRVKDEPCLILSCGNVTDVVAGMVFQNGSTVIRNYSSDSAITPTANSMPFTELKSQNAGDGIGAFQTEEGEIFISRACPKVEEGEFNDCDPFFYPQFWDEIGSGQFEVITEEKTAVEGGKVVYVQNEAEYRMIYFLPDGDDTKPYVLKSAHEFEYLSVAQVIDIDTDGQKEIIIRSSEMGSCCDYMGDYSIFTPNENGKYVEVKSEMPIVATGELLINPENQTMTYPFDRIGMNTELRERTYQLNYHSSGIEVDKISEPTYLEALVQMTTAKLEERAQVEDIDLPNADEAVDFMGIVHAGTDMQVQCGYWERWGSYIGCTLENRNNNASQTVEELDGCKRIGYLPAYEKLTLVCDYNQLVTVERF